MPPSSGRVPSGAVAPEPSDAAFADDAVEHGRGRGFERRASAELLERPVGGPGRHDNQVFMLVIGARSPSTSKRSASAESAG